MTQLYRSEGGSERDMESLGVMVVGAGGGGKFFRRRRRRRRDRRRHWGVDPRFLGFPLNHAIFR